MAWWLALSPYSEKQNVWLKLLFPEGNSTCTMGYRALVCLAEDTSVHDFRQMMHNDRRADPPLSCKALSLASSLSHCSAGQKWAVAFSSPSGNISNSQHISSLSVDSLSTTHTLWDIYACSASSYQTTAGIRICQVLMLWEGHNEPLCRLSLPNGRTVWKREEKTSSPQHRCRSQGSLKQGPGRGHAPGWVGFHTEAKPGVYSRKLNG